MKRLLIIPALLFFVACGNEEAKLKEEYNSVKAKYEAKKMTWEMAENDIQRQYDLLIELKASGISEQDESYKKEEKRLEEIKAKAEQKKATVDSLMTVMSDLANKIGEQK